MLQPARVGEFHRVQAYNEGLVVYLYDDSLYEEWKQRKDSPEKVVSGKRGSKRAAAFPVGDMLSYELRGDGEICIDLAVRVPLADEEMARLAALDPLVGFLRLPTGRLRVECANDFRFDPDLDEADEGGGALIETAPGAYHVRIYHVDMTALAGDEQYEYRGPQQVITLESAQTEETPAGARSHLTFPRRRKPSRKRKLDTSWQGRFEFEDGIFTGEFVHNYDVSGPCINFDSDVGILLDLKIGSKLLIEFDNARIEAIFLGNSQQMHPDADRFAAIRNHTKCGFVIDREGIEKLMLFEFPDRDMMHLDFRKTPLCGTPVRIRRFD